MHPVSAAGAEPTTGTPGREPPPAFATALRLVYLAREAARHGDASGPEAEALEECVRRAVDRVEAPPWLEAAPDAPGAEGCKLVTRIGMCPWDGARPRRAPPGAGPG